MKTVNTLLQNTFKPREILQIREMIHTQVIKEENLDHETNSKKKVNFVDNAKFSMKKWEIDTQEKLQNL